MNREEAKAFFIERIEKKDVSMFRENATECLYFEDVGEKSCCIIGTMLQKIMTEEEFMSFVKVYNDQVVSFLPSHYHNILPLLSHEISYIQDMHDSAVGSTEDKRNTVSQKIIKYINSLPN